MQKKIIALALASMATTASFAQTNVTIYGVADMGVANIRGSHNQTATQVISNGLTTSRIGFKGVEDLGNGLKALFVLEYRLDIDKNTGIGGAYDREQAPTGAAGTLSSPSGPARQQMVGLTGGFGTAVAGRLQTTAFDWMVKYVTLTTTAFDAHGAVVARTGARVQAGGDVRGSNAVAYISPSFGGVTVALNHAQAVEQTAGAAEGSAADGSRGATLAGIYYDNGPASVGFVAERLAGNGSFESFRRNDYALGASYDFGFAKLNATYQLTDNKLGVGVAGNRDAVWHIGAGIPVSAKGKVSVAYAQNNIKSTAAGDNSRAASVAYVHDLSKRTAVYAGYGWADGGQLNGAGANIGSTIAPTGTVANLGGSTHTIAAGVRHMF